MAAAEPTANGPHHATPSLSTQAAPTTTAVGRLPTREPQSTRLPAAHTPATPPISWIHKQFADAWSLEYPATWDVNAAGGDEGAVELRGDYSGHRYAVAFVYPIFEQAVDTFSLETWVAQELATLPAEKRSAITVRSKLSSTVSTAPLATISIETSGYLA